MRVDPSKKHRKPASVKIIIALCLLHIFVFIPGILMYFSENDVQHFRRAFEAYFLMNVFPIFILLGIWRKSAGSVRFLSFCGLIFSPITQSILIILFYIVLVIISFSKGVNKYTSPDLFETSKE